MTRALHKRLIKLAPKPMLRVVFAPMGVCALDWHRTELGSDPLVIVINHADKDL
jgi:hypothetical protein